MGRFFPQHLRTIFCLNLLVLVLVVSVRPVNAQGTLTTLATFDRTITGRFPVGNLTLAGNGLFYGYASQGGANGLDAGTIFSFDPHTNMLSNLKEFSNFDGARPFSTGLTLGSDGIFYGTTYGGNTINGAGVLFSFDPSTNTYTKQADFTAATGNGPSSSLIQGPNGLFYGTTNGAGSSAEGTIFSFNPLTHTIAKMADFNTASGYPGDFIFTFPTHSNLTLANNGIFYGTTFAAGSNGVGTIFSFNPTTNALQKVATFHSTEGAGPANMTLGPDGLLYGISNYGGKYGFGTIFSFDPATNTLQKVADFDVANGRSTGQLASLLLGPDGLFYGIATAGGNSSIDPLGPGYGTIFSFNAADGTITKLADFLGPNGANPNGGLVFGSDGDLYGLTKYGGNDQFNENQFGDPWGEGTIFKFSLSTTVVPESGSLLLFFPFLTAMVYHLQRRRTRETD